MNQLAEHIRQEQPHLMRYACYRLGNTDDAKDALQDAYLKVCDRLSDEKGSEVKDWRNYFSVPCRTSAHRDFLSRTD